MEKYMICEDSKGKLFYLKQVGPAGDRVWTDRRVNAQTWTTMAEANAFLTAEFSDSIRLGRKIVVSKA